MLIDLKKLKEFGFDVNGVIHVGAHHGQEIPVYMEMEIPCIMFEADVDTFKILNQRFNQTSTVILENFALGEKVESKVMYCETTNGGMSSSLLKPKKHLDYYPQIQFTEEKTVHQISLDEYVKTKGVDLKVFNFLMMDVQGYELEVLKGSKEALLSIDNIMTEINFEELYEGCVLAPELDSFLGEYGFRRLITAETTAGWGDAFYSKKQV